MLGVAHASQGVQKRAVSIGSAGDWLAKAGQIVSTLVATITETVTGWLSSLFGDSVDESDIADEITQKLEDFATTQAENVALYEVPYAIEEAVLQTWQEQGIAQVVWIMQEDACPACQSNAEQGPIPIGEPFVMNELGHPPQHSRCRCSLSMAE